MELMSGRRPTLLFAAAYLPALPALISIALMELIMMQTYQVGGPGTFALWLVGSAIGVCVTGALGDRYCRRKVLIGLHLAGLGVLACVPFAGWCPWVTFAASLCFAPSPVARASLLDNLPSAARVQVLAVAFGVKFLLWTLYPLWATCSSDTALAVLIGLFIFDLLLLFFTFEDTRRTKARSLFKMPKDEKKQRYLAVVFALACAEATFYLSDMLMDMGANPSNLLVALALALTLGTSTHLLFRPSFSSMQLLRFAYALGFVASAITCLSFIYTEPGIHEVRSLTLMLGALGGFYLPIAYDLILGWASFYRKGSVCGVLEAMQCGAALFALALISLVKPTQTMVLYAVPVFLIGATIVQYSAEVKMLTRFLGSLTKVSGEALSRER